MKKKYLLKITLLFFATCLTNSSFGQIYNADFSNDGDGFADHTTSSPPAGAPASTGSFGIAPNQWSLSYTSTPSSDASANSFKVIAGSLVSDDWGGQGIFESQAIDVSGISFVNIAASTLNSGANDNTFNYFYIIDGGSRVETSNISSTNGETINYAITGLDVSTATTLIVGFEFDENGVGNGYSTSSFTVLDSALAPAGFTLSAISGNTNETGTMATFSTVLNTQPTSNVVLNITSGDIGEIVVSTSTLTFTNLNWNTPQTITLTGIDDALQDGNKTVAITVSVDDASSNNAFDGISEIISVINEDDELPILVINEVLADPNSTTGDANGDGIVDTTADEFIEIYNTTGSNLDISNYYIQDAASGGTTRHIFPSGTSIPANQAIVVFSGGNIIGIPGLTQLASTGGLSINNTTETLTIYNPSNAIITQVVLAGATDQSQARNPDFTGSFVSHSTIVGNPVDFSPGKNNTNTTSFTPLITWSGGTNSDWNIDSNWIGSVKPVYSNDVLIPNVLTLPELSTASQIINLTVENNAGVTINGGGNLTVENNILLNTSTDITIISSISGTNTLNAGSLILKGSYSALEATGQFFYFTETNKDNTDDWSFIASPAIGEGIEKFANFVGLRTNNNNIAIAPYDNNGRAWDYYKTSPSTMPVDANETLLSAAGNFVIGKGYTISPNSTAGTIAATAKGNIGFQGDVPNANYTIPIAVGSNNAFNLVGNPYPSYIPLNDAADVTNNIIKINGSSGLDILNQDAAWFWDKEANGGLGDYSTINLGSSARFIAPAQGFFVQAKIGGGNFEFKKEMQNHQSSGIFNKNSTTKSEIKLSITDGTSVKFTDIFYIENKTTGFDNGYDSSMFGGVEHSFAIYTQLLTENEGVNLAIQTLPNTNFESMIIPVGIKANAGKEIKFTTATQNLPNGIHVYLEDRLLNIFTRLDKQNSNYSIKVLDALNGTGRFYMHTTSQVLHTTSEALSNISMYKIDQRNLRITGLKNIDTSLNIYNIFGSVILQTSLKATNQTTITLPNVASGVYIVQLQSENGTKSQKIMFN